MSLRNSWEHAENLRKQFFMSNDQDMLHQTISAWLSTKNLIDKLAMFSENETLEDLVTNEIHYISAPYFLGTLLQQKHGGDRAHYLGRACQFYKEFLSMCTCYELIPSTDLAAVSSIMNEDKRREISTSQAELRQQKIQRYKRDKELETAIMTLAKNPNMDEDEARSLSLLSINLQVSKAIEEIKFIEKELIILQSESKSRHLELDNEPAPENEDSRTWRIDRPTTLLGLGGKVLAPFVITSQRQSTSATVFRPDHSLPTMSIDEYLEQEKAQGGILSSNTEPQLSRDSSDCEDNDDWLESKRQSAINWDAFTEENPKGIGNTMNRG